MITTTGDSIRQTDPHRHKFDSAITEYLYGPDVWADEDTGDCEAPTGFVARFGKRLVFTDERGFVSSDRYPTHRDAQVAFDAIDAWYCAWSDEEDAPDDPDEYDDWVETHHIEVVEVAEAYCAYVVACATEGLEPHNREMWDIHNRPKGPI